MPIKHSLIVCHPEATSFTMAIAHRYAETVGRFRHQVEVRDLYRLGFDPLLKAEERPGAPDHAIAQDVVAELGALAGLTSSSLSIRSGSAPYPRQSKATSSACSEPSFPSRVRLRAIGTRCWQASGWFR